MTPEERANKVMDMMPAVVATLPDADRHLIYVAIYGALLDASESESVERRLAVQIPCDGHTARPWRFQAEAEDEDEGRDMGGLYGPDDAVVCHFGDAQQYYPTAGVPPSDADANLIALAPTAPHECSVPGCPGPENKRKLEAFDSVLAALKGARKLPRPWIHGGISYDDWEGAFVAIDAAVAKAEER